LISKKTTPLILQESETDIDIEWDIIIEKFIVEVSTIANNKFI
jgi:hypothetical protein